MTNRNRWADRLSKVIAEVECNADPNMGMWSALQSLDTMLIEALEPWERRVWNWLTEIEALDKHTITSQTIIEQFDLKQNHASMILKNLCDYGLLCRIRDTNGNTYVYKIFKHR